MARERKPEYSSTSILASPPLIETAKATSDLTSEEKLKQDLLTNFTTQLLEGKGEIKQKLEEFDVLFNKKIKELEESTKNQTANLDKKIEEFGEKIDSNLNKSENLSKSLKDDRNRNTEILAVFVAFFTFASINIQAFNTAQNIKQVLIITIVTGLMLLVLVSIFLFCSRSLWKYQLSDDISNFNWKSILIFGLSVLLVVSALLFLVFSDTLENSYVLPYCSVDSTKSCVLDYNDYQEFIKNKK
jgi:hypothetical protein